MHHRHYHSSARRAMFSAVMILIVMSLGTLGMHHIENMSYMDAFYFTSMIATGQGSTFTPATAAGKVFASAMAFISIGVVVASLGFLFGPFFGKLWRLGVIKLEEEVETIKSHKGGKKHGK